MIIINKVILMGRYTTDPNVRYSQGENSTCIADFTLAVDRRFKRDNDPTADFIRCVAFGKTAEIIEKYMRKGMRVTLSGRIQTGSYTNKNGDKVYTTDVVVEEIEFAESKQSSTSAPANQAMPPQMQGQASAPAMPPQMPQQTAPQPQQQQHHGIPYGQPQYQQAPPQQYYQQPVQQPQYQAQSQTSWRPEDDFVGVEGIKDGELPFD